MRKVLTLIFTLAFCVTPYAQITNKAAIAGRPEVLIPIGVCSDLFTLGGGAKLEASYKLDAGFRLYGTGGYGLSPGRGGGNLSLLSGGAGAGYDRFFIDRLGLSVWADGGAFIATWNGQSAWNYYARTGLDAEVRLGPSLTLIAGGSYSHYFGPRDAFLQAIGITLGLSVNLSGFAGEAVRVDGFKLDPIFPVFYSYYDKNSFGKIDIRNEEDATIRDVRVSFIIKQYMNEPKLCGTYAALSPNERVSVPIFALLKEDVLRLTENSKVGAETIVEYTFLGQRRELRFNETVLLNHRNAMTWDDDQRAAAFVSAKDPAVLRYSKFAAGLIRETDAGGEIDQNLKIAIGLFEGLRLYGLNYVVDPTTPYKELSENSAAVDFLQYPYQTLVYKGGDCDDLSIMFAAILQSVGVSSAFITVPGHIYVAIGLAADEVSARKGFAHQNDLIYAEGKVWLPLEITMMNDGFTKAWVYGAREWREAPANDRALLPIEQAWKKYEPVGIPGEDTRIVLPPADGVVAAFKTSLETVSTREVGAKAERIRVDYAGKNDELKLNNALGVLYARYGRLSDAKKEFEKAAKLGSASALCNLGNIAFIQKDYRAASEYFEKTIAIKPSNDLALLGLARSRYELEDYAEAEKRFAELKMTAPKMAAEYAYVGGGKNTGRAAAANEAKPRLPWDE
ncbi:MAG: tetratricopeptide repeat protein [Treponemataceae bacterium]